MIDVTEPLVAALGRVLQVVRGHAPTSLRRETSLLLYDFDVNEAALKAEHRDRLDRLIADVLLPAAPSTVVLDIIGRASQTGSERVNVPLSFNRAETVRQYLLAGGVADSDLPPARAVGSSLPIEPAPGDEDMLNRGVEIIVEWQIQLQQPDVIAPSTASGLWNIDLGATIGAAAGFGGQIQLGRLKKRATGESRSCQLMIVGADLGISLPITVAASAGIPAFDNGDFDTVTAVDFDWFDGRPVHLRAFSGSLIVGGLEANVLTFLAGDHSVSTKFAGVPIGVTLGAGVFLAVGFLNLTDD